MTIIKLHVLVLKQEVPAAIPDGPTLAARLYISNTRSIVLFLKNYVLKGKSFEGNPFSNRNYIDSLLE